ncbi:MAG: peptide ABC transporter substrate-binding protein [Pyrinomonadaceae bacterium]
MAPKKISRILTAILFVAGIAVLASCGELKNPEPETFFSETSPPKKQVFRWSNGRTPKSLDPALASAPPETDIVRAVYEGLTDTDPKTLEAVPAVAESWKSEQDGKVWVFELRKDAFWSNGERVTAHDFERSWKRLAAMGDSIPNHFLLHNLAGIHKIAASPTPQTEKTASDPTGKPAASPTASLESLGNTNVASADPKSTATPEQLKVGKLGVKAVGEHRLRVELAEADKEFPRLVAHPVFRPIHGDGENFKKNPVDSGAVTNGAFRIASIGKDGITLDRAEKYFGRTKVSLERVTFVPSENPEAALKAYRSGAVDVVTNAEFEPLALKLLTPYVDFKRTTHSAVNLYQFNVGRAPFNDRRVREALAISIDRDRLTQDDMDGATKPAYDFLPFEEGREVKIGKDPEKAKQLFVKAGFPSGVGFPKIRLVVNRNNVQERLAKSVAKMWKDSLGVDTELILLDSDEIASAVDSGEYDLVRRGVVLPTADETANMIAIFGHDSSINASIKKDPAGNENSGNPLEANSNANTAENSATGIDEVIVDTGASPDRVMTEEEAVLSLPAIPLYFPTSYSLVKPYVLGFEINTLDAPSLKSVSIDQNWKPKKSESK